MAQHFLKVAKTMFDWGKLLITSTFLFIILQYLIWNIVISALNMLPLEYRYALAFYLDNEL